MEACPDKILLNELIAGAVKDQDAERLFQHLEACEACAEYFDSGMRLDVTTPGEHGGFETTNDMVARGMSPSARIDRYLLKRQLGKGAFGVVWLALDEELQRLVAVKIPSSTLLKGQAEQDAFLKEARTLARLDHAHIVPVHDVGRTESGDVYVVSKFIEGGTLQDRIREGRLARDEIVGLLTTLADALHYAHTQRLIHRDIKPANILLEDSTRKAYVADFGLAIREEDYVLEDRIAGSPAYMSPEQARGEGHRLDGRSDIFSLGVVMYEMLTGNKPFDAETPSELIQQVISFDPTHPCDIDPTVPADLARICMKAVAKRTADRYTTAAELADELRSLKRGTGLGESDPGVPVVPKGLRSFDAEDAGFFLDLLPGSRDRDGLPTSVSFWKRRIENTDADQTFSVGLIYGPSGCGKSSLVKAGLIPRLANDVATIYVESAADETEDRLLRGLRKELPDLSDQYGLAAAIAAARRQDGPKVLIVLDQFEQWLHAHRGEEHTELAAALRQCDGTQVQTVLLVRDDFWMAASRFMSGIEVEMKQGSNIAAVDLFSVRHAGKVLREFGLANCDLESQPTDENQRFIDEAARGLAEDGMVVPVRLSLFAEMVKGKDWAASTLTALGGTAGVGVSFLEESFGARSANPRHRIHQDAAREVLRALLPGAGTNLKGHMRSHDDLLAISGYQDRPAQFVELLNALDGELRLITPADEGASVGATERSYQLTHDYLVPSLREWLTRKQNETRRGRAELKLAERTAQWMRLPENRYLPSGFEFASIATATERQKWSEDERRVMQRAARFHGLRWLAGLVLVLAVVLAGNYVRNRVRADRASLQAKGEKRKNEAEAARLVDSLFTAEVAEVPGIVGDSLRLQRFVEPLVRDRLAKAESRKEQLRAELALLPQDPRQLTAIHGHLLEAPAEEAMAIAEIVRQHAAAADTTEFVEQLWAVTKDGGGQCLPAACVLAETSPEDERWLTARQPVVEQLVRSRASSMILWKSALRPVRHHLASPLAEKLGDGSLSESQNTLALDLTLDFARENPAALAAALQRSTPLYFPAFVDLAKPDSAEVVAILAAVVETPAQPTWESQPGSEWPSLDADTARQVEAANGLVGDTFAFCQTLPLDELGPLAERMQAAGYRPSRIRRCLGKKAPQLSAVWARDGRDCVWHIGSKEEIEQRDAGLRERSYEPIDLAVFRPASESATAQFIVLWAKRDSDNAPNQLALALTQEEFDERDRILVIDGYRRHLAHSVLPAEDDRQLVSAIWEHAELQQRVNTGPDAPERLNIGMLLVDMHLAEQSAEPGPHKTILWEDSPSMESVEVRSTDPRQHLARCRQFIEEGYRPACVVGFANDEDERAVSVWHRPVASEAVKDEVARRHANAALALFQLGHPAQLWDLLKYSPDPRTRSYLIERLAAFDMSPPVLIDELFRDTTELSVKRAIVLALGQFNASQLTQETRDSLRPRLVRIFQGHNDPGLRGAVEWLLRRWGDGDLISEAKGQLQELEDARLQREESEPRDWYVTSQGHTMVAIDGGEFLMGSTGTDPDRRPREWLHKKRVSRRFAIASMEVTAAQYEVFHEESGDSEKDLLSDPTTLDYVKTPDSPIVGATWYEVVAYCNWLSKKEGIPESQWCYERNAEGKFGPGMRARENYLSLSGYRLPTEAEWEFACRAGSVTRRYYGSDEAMFKHYAWGWRNSKDMTKSVGLLKPNEFGLFDMLGNAAEWCYDQTSQYDGTVEDVETDTAPIENQFSRVVRGSAFNYYASDIRSAERSGKIPKNRAYVNGIRPTRTLRPTPK